MTPSEKGVRARLKLACGCEQSFELAADRIVETVDGQRIAVGKYPCAKGHALARR